MAHFHRKAPKGICATLLVAASCLTAVTPVMAHGNLSVEQTHDQDSRATIRLANGQMVVDFYTPRIFRIFQDPAGGDVRPPKSNPKADILVPSAHDGNVKVSVERSAQRVRVASQAVALDIDPSSGQITVTDLESGRTVMRQLRPTEFSPKHTTLEFAAGENEYFYGGGVQNGRFSHKGTKIEIVNTNSWTDGGVCSPAPFYWSTGGYALMWHTFAPGQYDFESEKKGVVTLRHDTDYLDLFVMVDAKPELLLQDYYKLTGNPVLLPKFAFYEGHLNAYNRDYWKEDPKGILFEDGKRYKESQKNNGGIKESLNGENDNYQFSARAVVDRYQKADYPLGWVLPNDGYGAGYGQTSTLDGNIANLKSFGDYARSKGVELGLWTQSNLHPIDSIPALLQRDIVKEVHDAGVRVLKTDVAWVGDGYSFGLNGIADVAQTMTREGNNARPFIITLDGWAGTQRYGGVWTGDQTGGEWEYIRFHIPTYIGAGLSGMSNITSDMDGIFGGKNPTVNIRDFQWKTFTPMQLNMDGWGANPKYPNALGEPAASINRNYLKLKSALMPYTYSLAHEAVTGQPIIRAMMLSDANSYTLGSATRYQYMYGPWLLVAPVYQSTAADKAGNDVRNGIYLPEGRWYDYFTGEAYTGGRILNNMPAPIWKLPLLVKAGAIIPMTRPHNNVKEMDRTVRIFDCFPEGESHFDLYDDDGTTIGYQKGQSAVTHITSSDNGKGKVTLHLLPAKGRYPGMTVRQATTLRIYATQPAKKVRVWANGKRMKAQVKFVDAPNLNQFSTPGNETASKVIKGHPWIVIDIDTVDITKTELKVEVSGVTCRPKDLLTKSHGTLSALVAPTVTSAPYALTPKWNPVTGADYYEINFDGQNYSTITADSLIFQDLTPGTDYTFKLRAVNADGASPWTSFSARTGEDPLADALRGVSGRLTDAKDMEGFGVEHLFDFKTSGDIWHTDYYSKAVPFTLTADLHQTATIDKMEYRPRPTGRNGILLQGTVEWSKNGKEWNKAGTFDWKADNQNKTFAFDNKPEARLIRIHVDKAVGNFGSGIELFVFKKKGTKTLLAGDINQDGKVDDNDLVSYMNYTGLKQGDADFEGYISKGDFNGNGHIDATDISYVATRLGDGITEDNDGTLSGDIIWRFDKPSYKAGETAVLTVSGKALEAVNALSLALPYNPKNLQFVKVNAQGVSKMRNLTYDRRHTDGSQVLYPTFVNIGTQPTLHGDAPLFTVEFRVLRACKLQAPAVQGRIVDREINEKTIGTEKQ